MNSGDLKVPPCWTSLRFRCSISGLQRLGRTGVAPMLMLVMGVFSQPTQAAEPIMTHVFVYGATPAGIAASLRAAEQGRDVTLVTPYRNIGGLKTNGLSNTDFHAFDGLTGVFLNFSQRVQDYYIEKYGADSQQVVDAFRGTHAEPHVNLRIFEEMLAEHESISIRRQLRLQSVEMQGDRIWSIQLTDSEGALIPARASIFIDATYEGDLMAAAGVPYRVGREGQAEYGESLAPETADGEVQGYNFRFVMTQVPENRVPLEPPAGYESEEFVDVLPLLEDGTIKTVFCARKEGLYKAHLPPLPNGKHDINDVSRNAVRLSLPQINNAWPDGDQATREAIFQAHLRHNIGLLYFVQTDPRVPEPFRTEANTWGWCRDEFQETGHIPEQLYVREARRMVGMHVYMQHDCLQLPDDARAKFFPDAIAMGEYSLNCHGTGHEGPVIGGKHTGEFYQVTPPYQIPYGVICPQTVENLLVPVAVSASHVGFCALRLEPIWTSLGEAAGVAAALAMESTSPVQEVSPQAIQRILHERGAATAYTSDVLPGHPDFVAVQWWSTLGGLMGLEQPHPAGIRGKGLTGQYSASYPNHEVQLAKPLTPELLAKWQKLCREHDVKIPTIEANSTRGSFIRAAFNNARPQ